MKKICALLFVFASSFSFNNLQAQVSDDEGEQIENCLLWKISNQTTNPSYVFTTIPALCPDDLYASDGLQEAFYDAEEVIFEVDNLTDEKKSEMQALLSTTKKRPLKSYFANDAEYKIVEKKLTAKLKDNAKDALLTKPLGIINMITMAELTCEQPYSYSKDFLDKAVETKKPISYLESPTEYLKLYEKVSDADFIKMLNNKLNTNNTESMLTLFRKKDIRGLLALKMSEDVYKNNTNDMFYYRNKRLAASLKSKINAKPCFIIIDAASAASENGLLMQLLQEGFSIEPVIR